MNGIANSQQSVFSFSFSESPSFDSFIATENEASIAILKSSISQIRLNSQLVYLYGKRSSGCTYLLKSSCHEANNLGLKSAYLSLDSSVEKIELLSQEANQLDLITIDDLDNASDSYQTQLALFNLFNSAVDSRCSVFFAAHTQPQNTNIKLVDLQTRLRSCLMLLIKQPSSDNLRFYVKNLFLKKHIPINEDIINYLLERYSRNCNDLSKAVNIIEQESLRTHKPLTKMFIRQCLSNK